MGERVLLAQGPPVAVRDGSGLVASGDLLAQGSECAGVAADQFESVGSSGPGCLRMIERASPYMAWAPAGSPSFRAMSARCPRRFETARPRFPCTRK